MARRIVLVGTLLLLNSVSIFAQAPTEPPLLYSKSWYEAVLVQELSRFAPGMEYRLLDTQEWSNYLHFDHFVSVVYEGLPADHRWDFSWPPKPGALIPFGEVDENGKFLAWWPACNFFRLDEKTCRAYIRLVVMHEAGHYQQWRALSGTPEFMARWTDGRHYQCREVEVYTWQIETGVAALEPFCDGGHPLKNVYYPGCAGSRWKADFAMALATLEKLLRRCP